MKLQHWSVINCVIVWEQLNSGWWLLFFRFDDSIIIVDFYRWPVIACHLVKNQFEKPMLMLEQKIVLVNSCHSCCCRCHYKLWLVCMLKKHRVDPVLNYQLFSCKQAAGDWVLFSFCDFVVLCYKKKFNFQSDLKVQLVSFLYKWIIWKYPFHTTPRSISGWCKIKTD